jgi:yecA family protein
VSDKLELPNPVDHVIEHSPLELTITRDGSSVRVFIYRGREDPGWILEIEDELGGSTVWDELFDSDRAALDEALQTIEQDGIHTLAESDNDDDARRASWDAAVAKPAIAELRQFLASAIDAMSFPRACGVFAAIASAPELRAPSEWLDLITSDHVFHDLADARRFTEGVMALYEEVARSVTACDAHCCPPPDDRDATREFCAGYVGIALSDSTWSRDAGAVAKLAPMCALAGAISPEKLGELARVSVDDPEPWLQRAREELAVTVASLHAYWSEGRKSAAARLRQQSLPQRRAAPKVGRNERCPCGSGRKFKKCCAQ